jgi:hypothetical protein
MVGLEPTTRDLQGRRSTTELHRHENSISQAVNKKKRASERERVKIRVLS